MQTESTSYFDATMARDASLAATLRAVRVRRRVRTSVRATAAIALISLPFWLLRPHPSASDPLIVENPLVIHSRPLAEDQLVHSLPLPDVRIRSSPESVRVARINTPADAAVPRLADREFHRLLAVHEVGLIEVDGIPARILPRQTGSAGH